jgi:hypothetical protein
MRALRSRSSLLALALWCAPGVVEAKDDEARPPIPEPLLAETVTDVDGAEAGEFEVEANGVSMRSRKGGAYTESASVEAEWLATRRLGLRLEPTAGATRERGSELAKKDVGASAGLSFKLLQDFEHDFHLQAEGLGRLPWEKSLVVQPGDPEMPLALDLRAALRSGVVTLRGSAGYGFGHDPAHVPARGSFAVLAPFEQGGRLGFWGFEADVDGARARPVVCAIDIVTSLASLGLPLRLGLAVPWVVGERSRTPSLGLMVRLFFESDRENAFSAGSSGR